MEIFQHPGESQAEMVWPSKQLFRNVVGASFVTITLSGAALTALIRNDFAVREHGIERISFVDATPRPGFDLDLID